MALPNSAFLKKKPCAFPNWLERNRFSHTQFGIEELQEIVERDGCKITVIIPGKEVAGTIASVITNSVRPLIAAGVVSRLVVIDAASQDGTGEIAAAHGAEVIQRRDIAPELGPSRGKGDALWRALLVTDGDIVAFLDGDTCDPDPAHLIGIIGPLLLQDGIQMVRASFDRPFKSASGDVTPNEGGRVTEILARPLLNSYWPELAGFSQPLAGEFAARRDLLEKLSFPVSYGVEIATLIDTYELLGLGGLAQADVGCRLNCHQPLRKLAVMSQEIMCTAMRRAGFATLSMPRMYLPWESNFQDIGAIERSPVAEYRATSGVVHAKREEKYGAIQGRHLSMLMAGELSSMTAEGLVKFQTLAIGKIYDLRSPIETTSGVHGQAEHADSGVASPKESNELKSMFLATGVEVVAAPVFSDEEWVPQRRDIRLKQYASAAHGYAEAYKQTLIHGSSAFRKIFEHLATANPCPILFHCSAGKDRTGVVSMLLLSFAGCSSSTIAYEYAFNDLDADWRASSIQRLLAQPGLSGNVNSVTNVVRAKSKYMAAAVGMLDRDFGGADGYCRSHLQLDEAKIAAVKANIVVGSCNKLR